MVYNFSARFINKWDLMVLLQCREAGKNEELSKWRYDWKALISLECITQMRACELATPAESLQKCPGWCLYVF